LILETVRENAIGIWRRREIAGHLQLNAVVAAVERIVKAVAKRAALSRPNLRNIELIIRTTLARSRRRD
jgi:hypothetical protein